MQKYEFILKKTKISFNIEMVDKEKNNMTIEVSFKESIPYRILKKHIQFSSWNTTTVRYSSSISKDGMSFKLTTIGKDKEIKKILEDILNKIDDEEVEIQKVKKEFKKHFKSKYSKK